MDFNEEYCRDYIIWELGEERRVPGEEKYEDGMQTIRQRLLERYGDEKLGICMAIVHDLIENRRNANGMGDDGDIWAAWRYNHVNRHADFSNPGTPRFAHLVLPPIPRKRSPDAPIIGNGNFYQPVPRRIISQPLLASDNEFITNVLSRDLNRDIVMYDVLDGTATGATATQDELLSEVASLRRILTVEYKDAGQQTDGDFFPPREEQKGFLRKLFAFVLKFHIL